MRVKRYIVCGVPVRFEGREEQKKKNRSLLSLLSLSLSLSLSIQVVVSRGAPFAADLCEDGDLTVLELLQDRGLVRAVVKVA